MKYKRLLALLLSLLLLLPFLPAAQAEAVTHQQLTDLIAEQYDAYAASIAQPNAADDTTEQLLNHALRGNHKDLAMDASDPLTACAFSSAMFREAVIQAVAFGLESMDMDKTDRKLMAFSCNWYENSSTYRITESVYNTTEDFEDDYSLYVPISGASPNAELNRNDEALILVAGSSRARMWLNRDTENPGRCHVRIVFFDTFDFNQDLTSALKKFNGSLATILNILGPLMGFKSYNWTSTVEFDLELPSLCSHRGGSFRWAAVDGKLEPVSEEGLTQLPLTATSSESGKITRYELEKPIHLRHTEPWVMEFRYKGSSALSITALNTCDKGRPYFIKASGVFLAGESLKNESGSGRTRHQYGLDISEYKATQWHTYRIENRISEDGSNMLWLLIDGQELGPMTGYYINSSGKEFYQDVQSDWASGKDFSVQYIGSKLHPLKGELEYLAIWQNCQANMLESTEPTCTQPGTVKETCRLCGITTVTEEAPALGHDLQTVPGTAPTCEKAGLTEGQACGRCGETVTAAQTLPALGHSPEAIPGKAPTCEAEGLTEGSSCTLCEKALTSRQPIPALGHSYEDGLCTLCGLQNPALIPGDANGDGSANYEDALLILRVSIGLEPMQPLYLLLCDLDGDCILNYADALTILRSSIGLS